MTEFTPIQLDDDSWYFDGPVGRAYVFRGTKKILLVDTTNGPGDLRTEIEKLAERLPIVLLNTHADDDHIGCNDQFETTLMHPAEFAYYACTAKEGYAVPQPVEEGDEIDLGERVFEVIYTPGHTYGSIMLLNRKERFLVSGDAIGKFVFIFGPQRNLRAQIYSLKKLRDKYIDLFDFIYTSHFDQKLESRYILTELACAEDILGKKIEGIAPGPIPLQPPEFKPAMMYMKDGAAFFDYADLPY